jgi:hypothetical protein
MTLREELREEESEERHVRLLSLVEEELSHARSTFGDFHNNHEGYAVIKEEVDELWDAIKAKGSSREHLATEAVQIAAMALRFVEDLLPDTLDRL